MTLEVKDNGEVKEILPSPPQVSLQTKTLAFLYRSRLIYIVSRTFAMKERSHNLMRKVKAWYDNEKYIPYANRPNKHEIALKSLQYRKKHEIARNYLLHQFGDIQKKHNTKLLFVIGPWYAASYNHPNSIERPKETEDRRREIKSILDEFSLQYIDLTDAFTDDYKLHGVKFDFLYDGHHNEYAHGVSGETIVGHLLKNVFITNSNCRN